MKSPFAILIKPHKSRLWLYSILLAISFFLTACGILQGAWRNIVQIQEPTMASTDSRIIASVISDHPKSINDTKQISITPSMLEPTEPITPSVTPSQTASSTVTPSFTHIPSNTFTNTHVYVPPTETQIPPTSAMIPPSNTPFPPSQTIQPTKTEVTEPPALEPTEEQTEKPAEEPMQDPTKEPTELAVCSTLTLTYEGQGSPLVASPKNSLNCPTNQFVQGQLITLSNAHPDVRWEIKGWNGTIDDYSVGETNQVRMPARNHTAGVIYGSVG